MMLIIDEKKHQTDSMYFSKKMSVTKYEIKTVTPKIHIFLMWEKNGGAIDAMAYKKIQKLFIRSE